MLLPVYRVLGEVYIRGAGRCAEMESTGGCILVIITGGDVLLDATEGAVVDISEDPPLTILPLMLFE